MGSWEAREQSAHLLATVMDTAVALPIALAATTDDLSPMPPSSISLVVSPAPATNTGRCPFCHNGSSTNISVVVLNQSLTRPPRKPCSCMLTPKFNRGVGFSSTVTTQAAGLRITKWCSLILCELEIP
ncbi:uncharacterized protein [Triticum aestivum]|uniref:uncharacterized protein isoform X2 n=2 Tax=Triticum TaxID=4564 RepID=UPI001D01743E|nr:uncharacterized protein LOC123137539 isoform X2 [Triticum aestivum]